jgi:hypothetical protein
MQSRELALTRWSNPGRVTLKMKGEEGKATPVLGRSIRLTNKAWMPSDLKLSVFCRESLARLLALEKYQNLIMTSITAGITLYIDHK